MSLKYESIIKQMSLEEKDPDDVRQKHLGGQWIL